MHPNNLVEYYPKEETLPPMIGKIVPMDRRHDDFYERFTEQWNQKLKNFKQPGMEDSLPFPIELLPAAPTTLPRKQVSKTSTVSGINSPDVLSPPMPVTPDILHFYLMPLTSRMNPSSRPLTPIQQFIHNSSKSEIKEPKYNRSQSNHLDPQSVLRTRTRQG